METYARCASITPAFRSRENVEHRGRWPRLSTRAATSSPRVLEAPQPPASADDLAIVDVEVGDPRSLWVEVGVSIAGDGLRGAQPVDRPLECLYREDQPRIRPFSGQDAAGREGVAGSRALESAAFSLRHRGAGDRGQAGSGAGSCCRPAGGPRCCRLQSQDGRVFHVAQQPP